MRNHELLTLLVGVFAASSTLQALTDIARKRWFFQILFFLGMGTQISTQGIQFSNALISRKELDRKAGFVLYAYTEKDMVLLNTIASDDPYLIGYRYFRDHRYPEAREKFEEAIKQGKFVAQSQYLIAHMIRMQSSDWTEAEDHLTKAIEYDDKYSPAYYARAIIKENGNEISGAIDDLTTSTSYGVIECFDINNPQEVKTVWPKIASNPRFTALQADCKRRHPEIATDTFQTQ